MSDLIVAQNVGKVYPLPRGVLRVLEGLDFRLKRGDLVAIMGASGVGKTTFLNLLGALDKPSDGTILLEGKDIHAQGDREIARLRNENIGFVFQFYHLLPEFTALENVSLPLLIRGMDKREAKNRARHILNEVHLEDKAEQKPALLSGGEQQRVAIARGIVNNPNILLADEPTGNLDQKTGTEIMQLLCDLHEKDDLTLIFVTHDPAKSKLAGRVVEMLDGHTVTNRT